MEVTTSKPNSNYKSWKELQEQISNISDANGRLAERNEKLTARNEQLEQIVKEYDLQNNFKTASNLQQNSNNIATIERDMFAKVFQACRNAKERIALQIIDGKVVSINTSVE
jgi:regulator of replication initiation timing